MDMGVRRYYSMEECVLFIFIVIIDNYFLALFLVINQITELIIIAYQPLYNNNQIYPQNKIKMQLSQHLQSKSNSNNFSSEPEPFQYMEPTLAQQNNYNNFLTNWKQCQRQSLSQQQSQRLSNLPSILKPNIFLNQNHDNSDNIYNKYTVEIVNYLKSKFIVQEIIQEIQQKRMVDLTEFTVIQFLFLLAFRAWCDINAALNTFVNQKKQQNNKKQNQEFRVLVVAMYKLCQKIEKIFQLYHKSLVFREKSFRNRLKSIVNFIFHNEKKTYRDKILFGIEGTDFTRDNQIKYTQQNSIPEIRKQLLEKSSKNITRVRNILLAYRKIMEIQFQKLEHLQDFTSVKQALIKEMQTKYKTKPTFI